MKKLKKSFLLLLLSFIGGGLFSIAYAETTIVNNTKYYVAIPLPETTYIIAPECYFQIPENQVVSEISITTEPLYKQFEAALYFQATQTDQTVQTNLQVLVNFNLQPSILSSHEERVCYITNFSQTWHDYHDKRTVDFGLQIEREGGSPLFLFAQHIFQIPSR